MRVDGSLTMRKLWRLTSALKDSFTLHSATLRESKYEYVDFLGKKSKNLSLRQHSPKMAETLDSLLSLKPLQSNIETEL